MFKKQTLELQRRLIAINVHCCFSCFSSLASWPGIFYRIQRALLVFLFFFFGSQAGDLLSHSVTRVSS